MKDSPASNELDANKRLPLLRIQLKVSPDEHPELYAALTRNATRGFAAKRIKNLASLELIASARRKGDVIDNSPRRSIDIAGTTTKQAHKGPNAPVRLVAAPISDIDC